MRSRVWDAVCESCLKRLIGTHGGRLIRVPRRWRPPIHRVLRDLDHGLSVRDVARKHRLNPRTVSRIGKTALLLLCALLLTPLPAFGGGKTGRHAWNYCYSCPRDSKGRIKRSSGAREKYLHSKGLTHTPAGCQVDHIVPLAKGGRDDPSNMQLLCGDALRAKERQELR